MQNIFLFYGENTYSSHQKLMLWKTEFIKKHGEESLEQIEGKSMDLAEFTTNIEALPFLSEKRLMIVKDLLSKAKADDQKRIAESLDNTVESCIVLFYENEIPDKRLSLFKKISKIGKVEEFKDLNPSGLAKWALDKAKKEGIKLDFSVANYLSQHCGPDLWTISNELEKLKIFANGKEISTKMINKLCTPSLSSSIFKLTDAIAQKNSKNSLSTFKILRESGEDLIRTFFMIVRHFRILIRVHEMTNKGENSLSITKKLKQHPFVIQKTSSQSKNFTREKLEEIYKELLEVDINLKTGKIKSYRGDNREIELAIEQLIINCCKQS